MLPAQDTSPSEEPGTNRSPVSDLEHLVQMPVAVDKAVETGVSENVVRRMSRSLNRQRSSPREFNQSVQTATVGINRSTDRDNMGSYVVNQIDQGKKGRGLSDSIHERLREQGIPAGGWKGDGPPPVAKNYIPEHARGRGRGRPENAGRRGQGRGNNPDREDREDRDEREDQDERDEREEQEDRDEREREEREDREEREREEREDQDEREREDREEREERDEREKREDRKDREDPGKRDRETKDRGQDRVQDKQRGKSRGKGNR